MGVYPRPHLDPTVASPNDAQTKQCTCCWGLLPLPFFGILKYSKDGLRDICKECRAQNFRLYRKTKYDVESRHDDNIVRSVILHNEKLLQTLLGTKYSCIGYCPHGQQEYKVVFGDGNYSMNSMTIFSSDGSMFESLEYSGVKEILAHASAILKLNSIRLEMTEADMIVSKRVIYLR